MDGFEPGCRSRSRLRFLRAVQHGVGWGVLGLVFLWVAEWGLDRNSPYPLERLRTPGESTRFLARDNTVLRVVPTPDGDRAIVVPLSRVSPHLVQALVAAEDKRFFEHRGVDLTAILRAAVLNAVSGRVVSGASTLSMQVVRLVEPRPRTFFSKAIEVFRARQLERAVNKETILEAYLNLAPFGGTLRGAEAASLCWFGKHARDLTVVEAAMLVAMLPGPTSRAPHRSPDRLIHYRNKVLDRMLEEGMITSEEHARAAVQPLGARRHAWPFRAPHYLDQLRRHERKSEREVRTSLDLGLQSRVERVVRGFDDAGVDGVAVVVVDRETGAVRALVGSRDYRVHPLNAATCRRSAGSTLKPFLFALALEAGIIGPDSLLADTPASFGGYAPENFTRDFLGPMRATDALSESRNVPAVRLLKRVGLDRFRQLLGRVGLPVEGELGLDAALGTLAVSPLELARAYAALFGSVSSATGVSEATRNALLRILGRHSPAPDLVNPNVLAWKTGTSSGRRDAWCVGLTADHVLAVWFGNLDGRGAPDLVGARTAARLLAAIVGG